MAVTITELSSGRRQNGKQAERLYLIAGASDEDNARDSLLSWGSLPASIGGMPILTSDCSVEETDIEGTFIGTASYAAPEFAQPAPDTFTLSFDIQGTATRITQSLSTVGSYAPAFGDERDAFYPMDFGGAINVSRDGTGFSVEGTDVLVPNLAFTVNYTFDEADVTQSYVTDTLAGTVGKVNNDTFFGFPAGELLLTKVSGQRRVNESSSVVYDISFGFSVSKNKTSLTIGGTPSISVASKDGWDFLWVYYEYDDNDGFTRKVPYSAYVERVYERVSFSGLGIS